MTKRSLGVSALCAAWLIERLTRVKGRPFSLPRPFLCAFGGKAAGESAIVTRHILADASNQPLRIEAPFEGVGAVKHEPFADFEQAGPVVAGADMGEDRSRRVAAFGRQSLDHHGTPCHGSEGVSWNDHGSPCTAASRTSG